MLTLILIELLFAEIILTPVAYYGGMIIEWVIYE
jgi:hypothetical protein